MKGKILILLCLLASLGGGRVEALAQEYAGYVAKPISDPSEIKTDDVTEYLIQIATGSHPDFLIFSNGTNAKETWIRPANSGVTSDHVLNKKVNNSEYYYFKFATDASGNFVIKNRGGYYWGLTENTSYEGQVTAMNAPISIVLEKDGDAFKMKTGSNYINDVSGNNRMYANSTTCTTTYKIYEIAEPATSTTANFYFYDAAGTRAFNAVALSAETDGIKTVATLATEAGLPGYISAEYYSDNTFTNPVTASSVATAGDYYVKTTPSSSFPFAIGEGWTSVREGSGWSATYVQTNLSDPIQKYALKFNGDWYNGFSIQRYDGQYLKNFSGTVMWTSVEAQACKFKSTESFNLQTTDGTYYIQKLSTWGETQGSLFLTNKIDNIAIFANGIEGIADNILQNFNSNKYVGSYSYSQQGTLTFAQLLAGEGKIQLDPQKYYIIEYREGTSTEVRMTTAGIVQQILPASPTYGVTALADYLDSFTQFWRFTDDNKLYSVNADCAFDADGNLGGTPAAVTLEPNGMDSDYRTLYRIRFANGKVPYYNSSTSELLIGSNNTSASTWSLREVDNFTFSPTLNKVDGKYYGTFCAPVNLKPQAWNHATPYTGKLTIQNVDGQDLTVLALTEVTTVIPAGMPIILIDETGDSWGSGSFAMTSEAAPTYTPDANWKGTFIDLKFADEATAKNYRTLGKGGAANTAGFYTPRATTKIPANRAYIEMPSASETQAMLPIRFDDGTLTWIDASILTGEQTDNAAIYDLSGRRIMQPQRGQLYIRGGKKFIAQ